MEATFERMIAQAVRGNQAAGPPQEPTVPDKCVLSYGYPLTRDDACLLVAKLYISHRSLFSR